jgi:spore germination protein KC
LRYRCLAILLLLGATMLSAGCNGSTETDEVAYIIGMAVDATDDDKIDVTYRIAIPRAIGMGGGGGAESNQTSEVITIRAINLAEAHNFLISIIARKPNFSHTKILGVGEKLARKGVNQFLGPTVRFREFRGSMLFNVFTGTAKEFITKNKPVLETLPSKGYETQALNAPDTDYFLRTTLHDFYENLKSNSSSPYAILYGISTQDLNPPASAPLPPAKENQYIAGFIPRQGGSLGEALGTAIFRQDKMVGTLTNEETRMLAILKGKFPGNFIVLQDPLEPRDSVSIRLRLMDKPDIAVRFTNGQAFITVKVSLEGEISSIPSGINYEYQYQQRLEDQISGAIKQNIEQMVKKTQELGSDVAGFGYYARSNFASYYDFMAMEWDEVYPQAVLEVSVVTEIRRNGLMQQTAPIR